MDHSAALWETDYREGGCGQRKVERPHAAAMVAGGQTPLGRKSRGMRDVGSGKGIIRNTEKSWPTVACVVAYREPHEMGATPAGWLENVQQNVRGSRVRSLTQWQVPPSRP